MVMCPECARADVALTRQCQQEMPLYQSVTVPLRQLNRAVCPEARTRISPDGVVSAGVCHEASLLSSRPGPMSEAAGDDEDLEPVPFIL